MKIIHYFFINHMARERTPGDSKGIREAVNRLLADPEHTKIYTDRTEDPAFQKMERALVEQAQRIRDGFASNELTKKYSDEEKSHILKEALRGVVNEFVTKYPEKAARYFIYKDTIPELNNPGLELVYGDMPEEIVESTAPVSIGEIPEEASPSSTRLPDPHPLNYAITEASGLDPHTHPAEDARANISSSSETLEATQESLESRLDAMEIEVGAREQKAGFFGKAGGKLREAIDWYKNQPKSHKWIVGGVILGGGFFATGAAAGAVGAMMLVNRGLAVGSTFSLSEGLALKFLEKRAAKEGREITEKERRVAIAGSAALALLVGGVLMAHTAEVASAKLGMPNDTPPTDHIEKSSEIKGKIVRNETLDSKVSATTAPEGTKVITPEKAAPSGETTPVESRAPAAQPSPEPTKPSPATTPTENLGTSPSHVSGEKLGTNAPTAGEGTHVVTPSASPETSHLVSVKPGDNLWKIMGHKLESDPRFTALSPEQKANVIANMEQHLRGMNTADLKQMGFSLGDINKITTTDTLNLSKVFGDQAFIDKTIAHAQGLTPEQIQSIHTNLEHPAGRPDVDPRPTARLAHVSPEISGTLEAPTPEGTMAPEVNPQPGITPEQLAANTDTHLRQGLNELFPEKKGFLGIGHVAGGINSPDWTHPQYGFGHIPANSVMTNSSWNLNILDKKAVGFSNHLKTMQLKAILDYAAQTYRIRPLPEETCEAFLRRAIDQSQLTGTPFQVPESSYPTAIAA